jgi:hypothetical protein
MQRLSGLALLAAFIAVSPGLLLAQPQPSQTHAPDGGTLQRFAEIDIPTIPNAPFSATVITEWTRLLPDGTEGTIKMRRLVARDSAGHVFEEHRALSPTGDQRPTRLLWVNYADPQRHEYYACVPFSKLCELAPLPQGIQRQPAGTPQAQGVAAASTKPEVKTEALGERRMDDLDVTGSREITFIPQGQFGNQKSEPVVREFWYSPHLQINLLTKRFDPRASSNLIFTVTDVNLTEPDPHTFMVPDYQIIKVPTRGAAMMSASVMTPMGNPQPPAPPATPGNR